MDTSTHWSLFGQIVILTLVQLGGLGTVTLVVLMAGVARHEFSLSGILMLQEMYTLENSRGVVQFFKRIFLWTLGIEAAGALFYCFSFVPQFGLARGLWYSFFAAASAFCNAGLNIDHSDSFFQPVTYRTAGFTTVPQEDLTENTCLLGDIFMFVGGSPVGTAGGVKTVTMFIVLLNVYAFLFFCGALMFTSEVDLTDAMYEITSAVSTVGLSRGITDHHLRRNGRKKPS